MIGRVFLLILAALGFWALGAVPARYLDGAVG